mmetsp:Transcript_71726/g.164373  ORF Transcript_71726/g.164373 Transcript_71726/m.164373 type:complete len:202 (+) Transcript_71726:212-817(+)
MLTLSLSRRRACSNRYEHARPSMPHKPSPNPSAMLRPPSREITPWDVGGLASASSDPDTTLDVTLDVTPDVTLFRARSTALADGAGRFSLRPERKCFFSHPNCEAGGPSLPWRAALPCCACVVSVAASAAAGCPASHSSARFTSCIVATSLSSRAPSTPSVVFTLEKRVAALPSNLALAASHFASLLASGFASILYWRRCL